jgi:hypothetical protein
LYRFDFDPGAMKRGNAEATSKRNPASVASGIYDMQEANLLIVKIEEDPILAKDKRHELRIVAVADGSHSRKNGDEGAYSCEVGDKVAPCLLAETLLDHNANRLNFSVE